MKDSNRVHALAGNSYEFTFKRPFSVIIAASIPSGPERLVLIVLTRPFLSASKMMSLTSWSDSSVLFWMVLGRAKLRFDWSGLILARNLRTRIISGKVLGKSSISGVRATENRSKVKIG